MGKLIVDERQKQELIELRKKNDELFQFADKEDRDEIRQRKGSSHMVIDLPIPSVRIDDKFKGLIEFKNEIHTPKHLTLPSPVGMAMRVIYGMIPFNRDLDPGMLPYDARAVNQRYYGIMLTNLIDSQYNSFVRLPDKVKAEIENNFTNMCRFHMICAYITQRFFISSTQELDTQITQ